jgi:hypothetical protein
MTCGNSDRGDVFFACGLFVSREAHLRLGEPLPCVGQISLSLLYLPYFAAVLAAERPAPFLVRASDLREYGRGDRI